MLDQTKTGETNPPPAHDPQDLERLLVSRQNAGDADGMAALYEPHAVLDAGEDPITETSSFNFQPSTFDSLRGSRGTGHESSPPPLATPQGRLLHGREAIRQFFRELVASGRKFELGEQQPALISGDLALTSTRCRNGTVTAEVARRQPDGTWLWALDKFSIS